MADINNVTLYAPDVSYTITYTKERLDNSQMTYHFKISTYLTPSAFLVVGNALLCTINVNGSSSQVRIKEEQFVWDGGQTRIREVSVTCPSATGGTAQTVIFDVISDGIYSTTSGVIHNSAYTVTSSPLLTTACSPPTACSLDVTVAETSATLSWSGAAGGVNNSISAYEVQYTDSSNGTTWGNWNALSVVNTTATSGSLSVSPPTTRGYYRKFRVRTRGAAGETYYSGWKESTNSVRRNTAPNRPTSVTATPVTYISELITVTWSGASGGTSAIKGCMIAARSSPDNAAWSAWEIKEIFELAASGGSRSVTPIYEPEIYMQYGVWTIDAFDIYSSEQISNSVFCEITVCDAPETCALSAALAENNITLSWSGASGGVGNAIMAYEVEYSESADNISWGSWVALTVVNTTDMHGSLSVSPPSTRGHYRRFRVRTRGSIGVAGYSDWTISSGSVRRKRLPTAPVVAAPLSANSTYNTAPRVFITTGVEPDGQNQIIEVKIDDSEWFNSINNAELFSVGGELGDNTNTVFTSGALSYGNHTVIIRCYDNTTHLRSSEVTRTFNLLEPPFEEITANVTHVKAAHILDLRSAVNNLRNYYNIASYTWSSDIISGKTQIRDWVYHIIEIRAAVNDVVDYINNFENNTFLPVSWLPLGTGRPRADVMGQLNEIIPIL